VTNTLIYYETEWACVVKDLILKALDVNALRFFILTNKAIVGTGQLGQPASTWCIEITVQMCRHRESNYAHPGHLMKRSFRV